MKARAHAPTVAWLAFGAVATAYAAPVVVSIDNTSAGVGSAPPVNRNLLGQNTIAQDNAGYLLEPDSTVWKTDPNPDFLSPAVALAPAVLRYPSGEADNYYWTQGVGPARGTCVGVYNNQTYTVYFGTDEFLALCQKTNAQPMVTVNIYHGGWATAARRHHPECSGAVQFRHLRRRWRTTEGDHATLHRCGRCEWHDHDRVCPIHRQS
jgi:hypothetical protein